MAKKKVETRFFKIRPETDKEQIALDIFHQFKKSKIFTKDAVRGAVKISGDFLDYYVDLCSSKKLLKPVDTGDRFTFNTDQSRLLGIGFKDSNCYLTVMDLGGNIVDKEIIEIELLLKGGSKNKDISAIVREIADQTKLNKNKYQSCGIAIPEEMIEMNPKSIDILTRGVHDLFGCRVFSTRSATAAGYADRDSREEVKDKNVLYVYSDVGIGVVFKRESIFEAYEYSDEKFGAYLRPWNQFSIVNTTKSLVSRGVGTEIVQMVKGNIENITMDVVLTAAENKDELAEDLVKRSGLALGVRVAYLINMFNVEYVLFGGGTEKDEGGFIECVHDSMAKFLSKDIMDNLKIVTGMMGKLSSSAGAASLCRRELFMEV